MLLCLQNYRIFSEYYNEYAAQHIFASDLDSKMRGDLAHLLPDLVVTQIPDASHVCMTDTARWPVLPSLHLHADSPIGIAEGHSIQCEPVHILNREHIIIARIIHNSVFNNNMIEQDRKSVV